MTLLTGTLPVAALLAVLAPVAAAQIPQGGSGAPLEDSRGRDISRTVLDRDNTRVSGTVFDPKGNPLGQVEIWVTNDNAPADRVRARSRPTGLYLARNLINLYSRDDVFGIIVRLRFESNGYETLEATVPVEKNALGEVFPILWPEGADRSQMQGWCLRLSGSLMNQKGKAVKKGVVAIAATGDPATEVQAIVTKGHYEALLWDVSGPLIVKASAPGFSPVEVRIPLEGEPRNDLVALVRQDLTLR